MCRTWGSNSGPLACQANSLPIELPRLVMLLRVLPGLKVYECQCFRNEFEHTHTHFNEYKLEHDFAALHGLCMLKVSTIYALVVEVTRHNIRNVLRMTLLSLRSTASRFLSICSQPYLVSAVNRIISSNTVCQKKGKFGQKYQLLECYLF